METWPVTPVNTVRTFTVRWTAVMDPPAWYTYIPGKTTTSKETFWVS
jgi:hypothetical protein